MTVQARFAATRLLREKILSFVQWNPGANAREVALGVEGPKGPTYMPKFHNNLRALELQGLVRREQEGNWVKWHSTVPAPNLLNRDEVEEWLAS